LLLLLFGAVYPVSHLAQKRARIVSPEYQLFFRFFEISSQSDRGRAAGLSVSCAY
jgi:hypothetical protein